VFTGKSNFDIDKFGENSFEAATRSCLGRGKKEKKSKRRIQLGSSFLDGGFGEAKPVVAHVEFSVVWANEDVPEDPQGSHRFGNVQPHEAR